MKAGIRRIFTTANAGGSEEAVLRSLADEAIAPAFAAEAAGLERLEAPAGDEGQVEAIATAIRSTAAKAREDPKAFVTTPAAHDAANGLARAYGIGACGTAN